MTQLGQRLAAEKRGEKQSVGFQRTPNLHEHAGQVVDELQGQRRDHKIERGVAKWQRLFVGGNERPRRRRAPNRGNCIGRHHCADRA